MKFHLVDRIESIEPGESIVTTKALSLAEEYLADHFPAFPVMPGVLMVEAMVQAAGWLVRLKQDYANSIIVLGLVRNVRYASFVQPGEVLRCEVKLLDIGESAAKFQGTGFVNDLQAVSGRFELRFFNLADQNDRLGDSDKTIIKQLKKQFELIGGPEALAKAGS